ncbi:hypothetical protein HUJ05_002654 [Dendroctonus ponderosae]|nr:hypothetical protein HUJ05_002654 [Dendroctonus ponderosae]
MLGNLLTYACRNVADSVACAAGFLQAVRANSNQPSIALLALYSSRFFSGTQYNNCIANIDGATTTSNGICADGFCDFVRCIRRTNSEILIADCYAMASQDNPAEEQGDQVILYKNITSCILATARCAKINPITGQPQTNRLTNIRYGFYGNQLTSVPLYNALQINPAGDLRIIALPATTSIQNYFCPREVNLRESSWMEYDC